jgi:hypothetical protein
MLSIWASIPMGSRVGGGDCDGVNTADQRQVQAARLVKAAQEFRDAAARLRASLAAPATVAPLEQVLQEITAGGTGSPPPPRRVSLHGGAFSRSRPTPELGRSRAP